MRTVFSVLAVGPLCVLATASSAQSGRLFLDEAPLDKAIDFPKEKLAEYYAKMTKEQIGVVRLLEGGLYNVNIRHVENATPDKYSTEFHEDTIDVWVSPVNDAPVVTATPGGITYTENDPATRLCPPAAGRGSTRFDMHFPFTIEPFGLDPAAAALLNQTIGFYDRFGLIRILNRSKKSAPGLLAHRVNVDTGGVQDVDYLHPFFTGRSIEAAVARPDVPGTERITFDTPSFPIFEPDPPAGSSCFVSETVEDGAVTCLRFDQSSACSNASRLL